MADAEPKPTAAQKKKSRSPAYPYVSLEKAIKRAREMYDKEGKHGARFADVAGHWSFKATSSGAMQTVAALKQFGLVSFDGGTAEQRIVKLTPLAIRILLDEREPERLQAIQEAALGPKVYRALWAKYGPVLPSDANMLSHLKIDLGYNPGAVDDLLRDFKDTIQFAKLKDAGTVPLVQEDESEDEEDEMNAAQQQDAIPPAPPIKPGTPVVKPHPQATLIQEREVFRVPLAQGRMVRVLFSGVDPTQGEISKLIALLDLMKDQYPVTLDAPKTEGDPT